MDGNGTDRGRARDIPGAPPPPLSSGTGGGYTPRLLSAIMGRMGERTHGRPARPRRGPAAAPVIASHRRSSMTNLLSEHKRDVFFKLIAAAAAVPGP